MKTGVGLLTTFIFRWFLFITFNKPVVPARLYLVKYHSKTDSSRGLREPLSSVNETSISIKTNRYKSHLCWGLQSRVPGANRTVMGIARSDHGDSSQREKMREKWQHPDFIAVSPFSRCFQSQGDTEGWREEKWGNEQEEEMPSSQCLWEDGSSG